MSIYHLQTEYRHSAMPPPSPITQRVLRTLQSCLVRPSIQTPTLTAETFRALFRLSRCRMDKVSCSMSTFQICLLRADPFVSARSIWPSPENLVYLFWSNKAAVYHIHDQPVPSNGNCTATLAHLDPYQRGETPACDPTFPETCQVGDLAGKHGKVELTNGSSTFTATYTDNFASTLEGIGAFFGNRSFVFHFANTTRITCANFEAVADSSSACSATTTTTSSSSSVTSFTSTTTRATSTGRHNATSTSSTSTTSFVTVAGGHTNAAKAMAAVGAAGLAFLL